MEMEKKLENTQWTQENEEAINEIQKEITTINEMPSFSSGDTIAVSYKIREGNKERIQQFQGVVIQRRGTGATETFTVRKMSGNVGVERIFPISSALC